jgi:hypothetical protein
VLVGCLDDFGVAHRSPGLDDGAYPGLRGLIHAVAEREEGIGPEHRSGRLVSARARLVHGHERGVDAGHLAGADPDRCAVTRQHDRIGLDASDRPPGEQQIRVLLGRRCAPGHHLPAVVA